MAKKIDLDSTRADRLKLSLRFRSRPVVVVVFDRDENNDWQTVAEGETSSISDVGFGARLKLKGGALDKIGDFLGKTLKVRFYLVDLPDPEIEFIPVFIDESFDPRFDFYAGCEFTKPIDMSPVWKRVF